MGDLNKPNINIGMLAHVDAGKTTLSEALLYKTGTIRKLGRVDTRDAFLDTNKQERARGITIFSKQAVVELEKARITLLDTPGHVDFNYEVSRSLAACDGAILVVDSSQGVEAQTLANVYLESRATPKPSGGFLQDIKFLCLFL